MDSPADSLLQKLLRHFVRQLCQAAWTWQEDAVNLLADQLPVDINNLRSRYLPTNRPEMNLAHWSRRTEWWHSAAPHLICRVS